MSVDLLLCGFSGEQSSGFSPWAHVPGVPVLTGEELVVFNVVLKRPLCSQALTLLPRSMN